MKYNFDEIIERSGTNSLKWDFTEEIFGEPGLHPMWVADMDFKVPQPVIDAIIRRAEHGIFGYSQGMEQYSESVNGWMNRRHGWDIKKEWLVYSPGIVPALNWIVRAYAKPGDKVIVQPPVYHPFYKAITNHGCEVIKNPLKLDNEKYAIDFDDLESKLDKDVKLLILCSPHNPVGRVWQKEELKRLGELCLKHNTLVVSDEIHADLVYEGYKHTPFASMSEDFALNSITCTSPSKTFNLAGLQVSNIIISNQELRKAFQEVLNLNAIHRPNLFAIEALQAAYQHGEEWLDQLLGYLKGNLDYVIKFVRDKLPGVKVIKPEGTYLVWMDFREWDMNGEELKEFMHKKAGIALNEGYIFGKAGEGFERMNIACPRRTLEEGLKRIEKAYLSSSINHR